MPLISVIIPIYNTERLLPKCIESVLAQTLSDIEIILIDDGSTDESGKICDSYACKDKRIHLVSTTLLLIICSPVLGFMKLLPTS